MLQPGIKETWLTVDGLRIHCLTAGADGSPVVLLHGGGLDSAELSWEEVIGPLAHQHRVFAPDLPGYGQSDRPHVQYSLDYYITFLEHFVNALHLFQVSLVGLSLGGGIAIGFSLRYPTRITRLVLVDTYGIQDHVAAHALSYLYVHIPGLDELSYWLIGRSRGMVRWTILAGLIYHPHHLSDELLERIYQVARQPGAGRAFISTQRNDLTWRGLHSNFIDRLQEISVPTLLIHGAADPAVPLACAQRAHTLIIGSELAIMQECKHWPQREQPDEFNRIMNEFMTI